MPMEIDRKQLKRRARESMSLSNPSFWVVALVYILMTTGVSYLVDFAPDAVYPFFYIAYTLYSWVAVFSFRLWSLWTCRRLEPGLGSLMEGFSVSGRVILMELMLLIRSMGWCMILAIPASLVMLAAPTPVVITAVVIFLVVGVEIILLRYSLAPYVLADYPDLGPAVAVNHSLRLTKGWIGELVKLHLSFLGWHVLSVVLAMAGMAIGMMISGDLAALMTLPLEEIPNQVQNAVYAPLTSLLSTLVSLPVTLYLTPYIEVTVAEFYHARTQLGDHMGNPLGNSEMPPV